MRLFKFFLLLLFFICSIVFFVQNMEILAKPLALQFDPMPTFINPDAAATGSFLAWKSTAVPLYLVIVLTFVVGVLFSCAYFLLERMRYAYLLVGKKRNIRILEKEMAKLKAELEKTQSLADKNAERAAVAEATVAEAAAAPAVEAKVPAEGESAQS